ncbi:MAG: Cys-tRNA(Pro) deacylase [Candidatus Nanopelagicales bacterium]
MAGGTPAVVALQAAGIAFTEHRYDHDPAAPSYGLEAAMALGLPAEQVFKTLLCGIDGRAHVAIVPVTTQLDLKAAAAAVGGKRAEMMPVDSAERMTGYIAGGISPFGQKRLLPTLIDETCELFDTIYVSGGRRGFDIGLAPADLIRVLSATVTDLTR